MTFVNYLRISLLGLTGLTGEDNKLSLISLQALNIKFKRLVGLVATTVIDSNTDGTGFLAMDTSFLITNNSMSIMILTHMLLLFVLP
jgi:hypothetical protein